MLLLSTALVISGFSPAFVKLVSAQTARTLTFTNKCSADVWIAPTTGAAGQCSAGCPSGSSCAGNGYCYFNNPTPSAGNYRVKAGASSVITYPHPADNGGTVWNGNFGFCMNGQTCSNTPANCDANGCGTTGPFALAEFTLANTFVDFYDISIISGVTVPISITPQTVDSTNTVSTSPYTCGNPGSNKAVTTGLGTAPWTFSPPSNEYQWVTPPSLSSPTTCTSASQCPSGQTCGLIHNNGAFQEVCGYLSGYWSAGAVCGIDRTTSIFGCNTPVTSGSYSGTVSDFQGCGVTSGSCYSGGADQYCCGCINWNTYLGNSAVPASTQQCINNNTKWDTTILPTLEFLKKGCPNCYTFPYDDPSSTFTCTKVVNNYNTQNYTITMCPNGVSWPGNPAGSGGSTGTTTSSVSHSTTTTSSGSTSTGKPGTCAGTAYTSSQVCDNGHICPSGQYYCNGSCYNPSTSCCNNNALGSATGSCLCAGQNQYYDGTSYVCDNGQLCPKGSYNCGGGCYNPSNYGCCNGALTAAGQGC